jgi:hypothetical protein
MHVRASPQALQVDAIPFRVGISDLPSPPVIVASNAAGFIPNPEVYTLQSTVTGSRHGSTDSLVITSSVLLSPCANLE